MYGSAPVPLLNLQPDHPQPPAPTR
jgi:hypothetical protein